MQRMLSSRTTEGAAVWVRPSVALGGGLTGSLVLYAVAKQHVSLHFLLFFFFLHFFSTLPLAAILLHFFVFLSVFAAHADRMHTVDCASHPHTPAVATGGRQAVWPKGW